MLMYFVTQLALINTLSLLTVYQLEWKFLLDAATTPAASMGGNWSFLYGESIHDVKFILFVLRVDLIKVRYYWLHETAALLVQTD